MKYRVCLLCVLWASVVNAFSLDREAFSFTNYDLNIRIEPAQQRFAARGKLTLRNNTTNPQRIAVLQISSSLDWRSIQAGGKPLQFVAQPYTSDVDHTGAFSEAIVTLLEAVAPRGTVDLEIAYEGVIVLDATRLKRIGTPETAANSNDWDQISPNFTAVRGAGYVTWYPIATENANLSDGNNVADALARWKTREAASTMRLQFAVIGDEAEPPELLVNATACPTAHEVQHQFLADCSYRSLGSTVPTFVIADYQSVNRAAIEVHFLRGHDASATNYADAAEKVVPLISEWFGAARTKAEAADLPNLDAPPFESGPLLLTPLSGTNPKLAGLMAAHQLTHAAFSSPRPWINEGLAYFAQVLYLEHQTGRKAAIDYMQSHRLSFKAAEKQLANPEDETSQSLVNTNDEEIYSSKAMSVWWMLRDMVGDSALKKALASYRSDHDQEPSYLPHLIQAQTPKDLEWFFDDWLYRDRGLPDFKVVSASTRKLLPDGYMVAITVENTGAAGAEVPLTVKFAGGEVTKRLAVRGKSTGVIRVEVTKLPEEIVVNDGSVPESDMTNNMFKIEASDAAK